MAANALTKMKVKLGQLEIDRTNLKTEADGLCRTISDILVPELTSIEEMDIEKASAYMDDLVMKKAELLYITMEIYKLEKALGK